MFDGVFFFLFQIVSCSGDGKIYFTDVTREDTYGTYQFDCHFGTTYEVGQFIISVHFLTLSC